MKERDREDSFKPNLISDTGSTSSVCTTNKKAKHETSPITRNGKILSTRRKRYHPTQVRKKASVIDDQSPTQDWKKTGVISDQNLADIRDASNESFQDIPHATRLTTLTSLRDVTSNWRRCAHRKEKSKRKRKEGESIVGESGSVQKGLHCPQHRHCCLV